MKNPRERILFFVTVGVVGLAMGYMLYFKALIQPTRLDRAQIATVESDIENLETELARGDHFRARLAKWAESSFGGEPLKASEHSRAHLIQLHARAGLEEKVLVLSNFAGRKLPKGAGQEIGWTLKTRGAMNQVIDLLFLLQNDPRLHRLENISWMPVSGSNAVELNLKYVTLVPETAPGEKPVEFVAGEPPKEDPLAAPQRKLYAVISERDLFRPYIQRPPAPPAEVVQNPPPVNRLAFQKVVSLSTLAGQPTVVVRDTNENVTRTYQVGSKLLGGEIVHVDYRPMPREDKPYLDSPSRVILKIGAEFWAVELGHTLAQKHPVPDTLVPEALKDDAQPLPQPEEPKTQETIGGSR